MTPHPDENRRRFEIIIKVLSSKRRLLSDHIDILEDFLNIRGIQEPQSRTGRIVRISATSIGAISLTTAASGLILKSSGNLKYGVGIVAGLGLGIVAGRDWLAIYSNWKESQRLSMLLDALTRYHNLLKRNFSYLTDSFLLTGGTISEQDEILEGNCIDSLVKIIRLLHGFVTDLDDKSPITAELPDYQPFEDLAPFLTSSVDPEGAKRGFKEIYTIFLYIQSQFVLRICINLVDKTSPMDLNEIRRELESELVRKELQIVKRRIIRDGRPENIIKCSDLMTKVPTAGGEQSLGKLKWTTTNLSTKLVLQLNQFERFHEKLLNLKNELSSVYNKKLSELNDDLSAMESLFVTSSCEFENCQILMRKILNIDQGGGGGQVSLKNLQPDNIAEKNDCQVVDQSTAISIDDEFFILDGQMAEKDQQSTAMDGQVDEVRNEKILKTSFKPVLKQLRKQIDPLKENMLERERKFLQQQGVQLPVEALKEPPAKQILYSSSTESEDELGDDFVLRKKEKKGNFAPRPSKYDENRKFLEEKVQMGVFRLPPPINLCSTEDVLE